MRTLTNGDFTVVAFDYAVYKQEHNILRCTVTGAYTMKNVTVDILSGATKLATYNMNTAGKCFVDLTDYVRTYQSGALTVKAIYDGADVIGSVYIDWSVIGLISPTKLFVPDTPEAADIRQTVGVAHNYLLPTRVLQPLASEGAIEIYGLQGSYLLKSDSGQVVPARWYVHCEGGCTDLAVMTASDFIIQTYADVFGLTRTPAQIAPYLQDSGDTFIYDFADVLFPAKDEADEACDEISANTTDKGYPINLPDIWSLSTGNGHTTETQVTSATFATLSHGDNDTALGVAGADKHIAQSVIVQPRLCDTLYAAVRWVSATGHTRTAVWELREHTVAVGDKLNIDAPDGEYDERKGREDNLVLRLQGLTQYDIWYYGDIVTSSSVEISLNGSTWRTVKVTSKDVTIPDGNGGELQELKVSITYADYDAVAM